MCQLPVQALILSSRFTRERWHFYKRESNVEVCDATAAHDHYNAGYQKITSL